MVVIAKNMLKRFSEREEFQLLSWLSYSSVQIYIQVQQVNALYFQVGTIRSTLLAYKYVGKEGMGKGGVVVNISGKFGLEAFPEAPTYSASQHAILGLSRSFGGEKHVERSGVRVITLCPGLTKTPLLKNLECKGMTDAMGKELSAAAEKKKKQQPEACGEAVVHLVKHAESGSIWTVEGSRLFFVSLPRVEKFSTLAAQFM